MDSLRLVRPTLFASLLAGLILFSFVAFSAAQSLDPSTALPPPPDSTPAPPPPQDSPPITDTGSPSAVAPSEPPQITPDTLAPPDSTGQVDSGPITTSSALAGQSAAASATDDTLWSVGGFVRSDPSTGTVSVGIPIEVAPGRRGLQPALSLVYWLGNGNGWLGPGWKLEMGASNAARALA